MAVIGCHGIRERRMQPEVNERKGSNETDRPHDEKHEQRERAVEAVILLASSAIADQVHDARPRNPRRNERKVS